MTISVTRALAELKTLDDRITKATQHGYVVITVGGKVVGTARTQDDVENAIKNQYQSFTDLVSRRNKLKCAIVKSNAETKVQVGDKEMTVAEAIERKNSVQFEQQMINSLAQQFRGAAAQVEKTNTDANNRLNQMLEVNLGKDRKTSEEDFEAIAKPFMAKNEAKLVDPLKLEELVEKLQADVDDFKLNVDFALSEVNALTKLDV